MSPRLFHFRVVQRQSDFIAGAYGTAAVVVVVLLFTATKFGTATCLKAKLNALMFQARSLTCRVASGHARPGGPALFFQLW